MVWDQRLRPEFPLFSIYPLKSLVMYILLCALGVLCGEFLERLEEN